jgi:outer membrane protein TolC
MKQQFLKTSMFCMVLLVFFGATAQTTPTVNKYAFSVQQAVDYASKNNVQVKNALLNLKNQEQVNKEITAAALPTVSGNISSVYNPNIAVQNIPDFISPATYGVLVNEGVRNGNTGQPIMMPSSFGNIAAQFGTKYNTTAAVSLQQLLFDGQVFIGLQARKTSIDFQTKNIEVTEEAIKTNIYKIYYQLVVGKTQLAIIDANITRLEKLLVDTKAMFQSGFAEKLDINKINVQLANLKTQKASTENAIAVGYLGLKVLMGMPVQDSLVLTDDITEDQIKAGVLVDAYQYSDRKDYQYAELGKKLSEYNVRRYKLSYLPTVALSGNYAKNAQRNKFDFFGNGDWFTVSSVGLNISVPIFSGFAKDARVKQAQISLAQTNNTLANFKNQIDYEVSQASMNLKVALAAIDDQRQNKELAETVYDQTIKKFQAGVGSNTEITAAQTDKTTAESNYINALYNAIIAKIDYQKAIGKL